MSFDFKGILDDVVKYLTTLAQRTGVLSEMEHDGLRVVQQKLGLPSCTIEAPEPETEPSPGAPQPYTPAGGQGNETQAVFPPPADPTPPVTFSDGDGGGTNV